MQLLASSWPGGVGGGGARGGAAMDAPGVPINCYWDTQLYGAVPQRAQPVGPPFAYPALPQRFWYPWFSDGGSGGGGQHSLPGAAFPVLGPGIMAMSTAGAGDSKPAMQPGLLPAGPPCGDTRAHAGAMTGIPMGFVPYGGMAARGGGGVAALTAVAPALALSTAGNRSVSDATPTPGQPGVGDSVDSARGAAPVKVQKKRPRLVGTRDSGGSGGDGTNGGTGDDPGRRDDFKGGADALPLLPTAASAYWLPPPEGCAAPVPFTRPVAIASQGVDGGVAFNGHGWPTLGGSGKAPALVTTHGMEAVKEAYPFAAVASAPAASFTPPDDGPTVKVFCCTRCSYRTSRLGDLTKHNRIHDGVKPHLCPECGYATADSSNYYRYECACCCLGLPRCGKFV